MGHKKAEVKLSSQKFHEESSWNKQILVYLIQVMGPAILCLIVISGVFLGSVITTQNEFTFIFLSILRTLIFFAPNLSCMVKQYEDLEVC